MNKKKICLTLSLLCSIAFAYNNSDLVAAQTNYQNSVKELDDANEAMLQASQALATQNKQLVNTQKNIHILQQQASAANARIKAQELKVKDAKNKVNSIWLSIQQQ